MMRTLLSGCCMPVVVGALCLSGFCADTNAPVAAATPVTAIGAVGTNGFARVDSSLPEPDDLSHTILRTLNPNDTISMSVYGESDLTTQTVIDSNGTVILPLLGQVKIGGLTLREATDLIRRRYNKDYLVNPQVTVTVVQYAERRFAVMGQVQRPGSYDFPQNQPVNLLEAIAMAGGYTRLGSPSRVSVRRAENGVAKIIFVDARKMARDQRKKSFQILPDDIISVGERTF